MSRKPINKLRPDETRDAVWEEIRCQNGYGSFSVSEIAYSTQLGVDTVRDYITGLFNAGYLVKVERPLPESFKTQYYRLERDCGIEAPRVRKDGTEVVMGRGREQMWRALGIMAQKGIRFTFRDLCLYSSTDEIPVAEDDAKHFIRYLYAAGYLLQVEAGKPGIPARYRMMQSKWTGPKPPQIQRVRQLYDPNLKRVVWSEDGGSE